MYAVYPATISASRPTSDAMIAATASHLISRGVGGGSRGLAGDSDMAVRSLRELLRFRQCGALLHRLPADATKPGLPAIAQSRAIADLDLKTRAMLQTQKVVVIRLVLELNPVEVFTWRQDVATQETLMVISRRQPNGMHHRFPIALRLAVNGHFDAAHDGRTYTLVDPEQSQSSATVRADQIRPHLRAHLLALDVGGVARDDQGQQADQGSDDRGQCIPADAPLYVCG